jgi:hypothetical protein
MKPLLTALMLGNAALFVFGALQHAGVAVGPLHEPVIVPASVVEVLCAMALSWGAAAVLKQSLKAWERRSSEFGCHPWRGDRNGCASYRRRSADRKQRPLPPNHAGAGDRLARDPPCSHGTHSAEAELNRSLSGCAFS